MFYEQNCYPCIVMEPLVERLEDELNMKIGKLEVWYNKNNRKLLTEYAGFSSVPFFYNETSGKKITGECDYDNLKNWALSSKND